MKTYDLLIVGAGLIGKSLALALQKYGFHIALVEKLPYSKIIQNGFSFRPLSLSRTSIQFLEVLGLWQNMSEISAPIRAVHVSEKGRFGSTYLQAKDYGIDSFGAVIDANILDQSLAKALQGIDCYYEATPSDFIKSSEYWQFTIHDKPMRAKLLIGADGTESILRELDNISVKRHLLDQCALIVSISLHEKNQSVAYERFIETGSLAILPSRTHQVKGVWIASQREIDKIQQENDRQLLERLQQAIGYRLGKFKEIHSRFIHTLQVVASERLYGHRLALIGNAANTFHPLIAQGFNIGLRDVAELAQQLVTFQNQGIGERECLQRFADARHREHESCHRITLNLLEIFGSKNFPWKFVRSAGLMFCDLFPNLKHWIAASGMGLQYTLPNLSRGVPLDE